MRRFSKLLMVCVFVSATILVFVAPVHALTASSIVVTGVTETGGCAQILGVDTTLTRTPTVDDGGGEDGYYGIVYDGNGVALVSDDLGATVANGTQTLSVSVNDYIESAPTARPFTVRFYDINTAFPGQLPVATVQGFPTVIEATFDPADFGVCGDLPLVAAVGPVPGCNAQISIPSTAVGGAFVGDAPVYWMPGEATGVTIPAGNTALVIGVDASGQYYKIIWNCDFVWVPVGSMGPNYDAVWNGAPLPAGVVE